jgi:diguanylate cyclase (GGDEF)-like protein
MHDTLTRLPNRSQLNLRLQQAIDRRRHNGGMLAVMCIDVDNFKDINDTLGHPVGDVILKATAERLLAASGPTTIVARLSGDEFAILIEDVKNETILRTAAERYLRCASIAHEIDGQEVVCTISIGLSVSPGDGSDPATLMKNADLALYRAKADGRNTLRFFTKEMDAEVQRRRRLEAELRRDLGTKRIAVNYQPQFDLWTGKVIGYEALARWSHPELGNVSPAEFIPIAESSGLMSKLSERILLSACRTARDWPDDIKLAVNLSAAQFRTGEVSSAVERILAQTRLPPQRLEVEITESVLLQNTISAQSNLSRMRGLGISIALDDFGTGYSSLSYLSRFPIDKIKIDRSFVQRMCEDANTAAIVSAIVGLGKTLQLDITAEGVETREQLALLRAMGCHQVQGFLFGMPSETPDFPVPQVILMQEALNRAAG